MTSATKVSQIERVLQTELHSSYRIDIAIAPTSTWSCHNPCTEPKGRRAQNWTCTALQLSGRVCGAPARPPPNATPRLKPAFPIDMPQLPTSFLPASSSLICPYLVARHSPFTSYSSASLSPHESLQTVASNPALPRSVQHSPLLAPFFPTALFLPGAVLSARAPHIVHRTLWSFLRCSRAPRCACTCPCAASSRSRGFHTCVLANQIRARSETPRPVGFTPSTPELPPSMIVPVGTPAPVPADFVVLPVLVILTTSMRMCACVCGIPSRMPELSPSMIVPCAIGLPSFVLYPSIGTLVPVPADFVLYVLVVPTTSMHVWHPLARALSPLPVVPQLDPRKPARVAKHLDRSDSRLPCSLGLSMVPVRFPPYAIGLTSSPALASPRLPLITSSFLPNRALLTWRGPERPIAYRLLQPFPPCARACAASPRPRAVAAARGSAPGSSQIKSAPAAKHLNRSTSRLPRSPGLGLSMIPVRFRILLSVFISGSPPPSSTRAPMVQKLQPQPTDFAARASVQHARSRYHGWRWSACLNRSGHRDEGRTSEAYGRGRWSRGHMKKESGDVSDMAMLNRSGPDDVITPEQSSLVFQPLPPAASPPSVKFSLLPMNYAITFSSPNKADRVLSIHSESSPTLNEVRIAAITGLDDTSWDVAQWTDEPSTVHRPRIPERPAVRKTVLRETLEQKEGLGRQVLQNQTDIRQLKESVSMLVNELSTVQSGLIELTAKNVYTSDVVELHECFDLCLQGFSDVIFDTHSQLPGRLTDKEKARMKQYKSDFTYILSPAPASLPQDVIALRAKALKLLTPPQRELCEFLYKHWKAGRAQRNAQQHERPDRQTALERLEGAGLDLDGLRILKEFLDTNPARLPGWGENPADVHLRRLFAATGTYETVAVLRQKLEKLRAGRAVTEKLWGQHAQQQA
ncbi:hypothetical protein K438DRAFT_1990442 [Mycena galopus ATCC 62051]|nr:hypothetical protein K438DRAFT_1990442 [Mycena galopus ATCC 62051]